MRTIECGKCDGKGSITGFDHIENGRCFVCQGTGTVTAKNRTAREIALQGVMNSLSPFQDEMCQPVRVEDNDYYRFYAGRAARAFKMYATYDSADARRILRTLHSTAQHLIVEAAK